MTAECDCGATKAARAEACAECLALERGQGLRRSTHGVKAQGETSAEYQRRRREAKVAAGMCSTCYARPANKPLATCVPCLQRCSRTNKERPTCVAEGCTRHIGTAYRMCATHRRQVAAGSRTGVNKIPEELVPEILRLYATGIGYRLTAKRVGVGVRTVQRYVAKAGMVSRPRGGANNVGPRRAVEED